jgi:hypothetical protein
MPMGKKSTPLSWIAGYPPLFQDVFKLKVVAIRVVIHLWIASG